MNLPWAYAAWYLLTLTFSESDFVGTNFIHVLTHLRVFRWCNKILSIGFALGTGGGLSKPAL